tara:strand:+ start:11239 stop:14061 length:2823 start_codon:yes stop_codon:yes gene_type:complete
MSFGSTKLLAASGGEDAYEIEQSIMLDATDDAHLEITPSSAGNQRTWTQSCWIKLTGAGDGYMGFYGFPGGAAVSYYTGLFYYTGGNIVLLDNYGAGAYSGPYVTFNTGLNDRSAWYHLLLIFDTTQSTDTNRIQVWVNGVRCTNISATTWPSLNYQGSCNSTALHTINQVQDAYYGDVMFAEYHHIDGTVKAYTDFTETDSTTGQLIPKKYEGGSYGTNGFYLKFVSGAIGTDSSGEGNNLTASNLANADVLLDTPTNNFPTVNSLEPYNTTVSTLVQGSRKVLAASYSSGNYGNHFTTFKLPESGKWYVEMVGGVQAGSGNRTQLVVNEGFIIPTQGSNIASDSNSTGIDLTLYGNTLDMYDGGSTVGTQVTGLTASYYVLALAIDVDNNKVYGGYDSGSAITWLNSGDPAGNSNGTAHTFTSDSKIGVSTATSSDNANRSYLAMNFGQSSSFAFSSWTSRGNADGSGEGDFYYSPPSGFKALCTKNLPTPTIKLSTNHFNAILYTGNETEDRALTGVGFRPDWVWLKSRNYNYWHQWHDAVRGVAGGLLSSNRTDAQDATYSLVSLDSDGFTVMKDAANDGQNDDGKTYVAWNWRLEGATPSKTYTTKVVSDSGNKYRFNDYGTSAVTLNLQEGGTYTFDQSDSSNSGHPLRFSTTSDGSHGGGSEYTTGVTTSGTPGSSGAYTRITVAASAPTLYYYCTAHSGMGGQANTTITFGSTNLDGGSLSTVSVNTTAGVSIINVVGTGSDTTYGHGLGVIPKVYIVKLTSGTGDWYLQTSALDGGWDYLQLNTTAASNSMSATAPTSSVLYSSVTSSATAVFYAFAEIAGFSKFGSYKGNGNANGTYVYTGFRPAWTMIKRTDSTNSWIISDSKISPINLIDDYLAADLAQAEATTSAVGIDFLSNGFKIRNNANAMNNSSGTYFYMAFAKFPFKYANAR